MVQPRRLNADAPCGNRPYFTTCFRRHAKSHVTYAVNRVCAVGTVALPRIDMLVRYPAQANVAELALASGSIYSMHADFFNAWDPAAFAQLVDRIR